jgi:hypothetical protein
VRYILKISEQAQSIWSWIPLWVLQDCSIERSTTHRRMRRLREGRKPATGWKRRCMQVCYCRGSLVGRVTTLTYHRASNSILQRNCGGDIGLWRFGDCIDRRSFSNVCSAVSDAVSIRMKLSMSVRKLLKVELKDEMAMTSDEY